jgi:hypothetical protein
MEAISIKVKLKPVIAFLKSREFLLFSPVYFFLSYFLLILKEDSARMWRDGTLVGVHSSLMAFNYLNNEQDRLLQYLVPEILHRLLGIHIIHAYALARLGFIFLAFLVFHYYLRRWFSSGESLAGTVILAACIPLAFTVNDVQESAPLLMLAFIACLWAIRDNHPIWFAIFLLIGGGLTNESALVLPAVYFFYNARSLKFKELFRVGWQTVVVALPAFIAQGTLRIINWHLPHLGGAYHLDENLTNIWNALRHLNPLDYDLGPYLFPAVMFTIFWVYALIGYRRSPRFVQRALWMVPLFVIPNLITGIFREVRQMVPLGFVLIPPSLFLLFRSRSGEPVPARPDSPTPDEPHHL